MDLAVGIARSKTRWQLRGVGESRTDDALVEDALQLQQLLPFAL